MSAPVSNRKSRRAAYALEAKAFASGRWGEWERIKTPDGAPGATGWAKDVRWVWRNRLYAVLCRHVDTPMGTIIHCAIRSASQLEPPWRDMQRIKAELFGPELTAIEVMPPASKTIDGADMYHMWILENPLPFGLADEAQAHFQEAGR